MSRQSSLEQALGLNEVSEAAFQDTCQAADAMLVDVNSWLDQVCTNIATPPEPSIEDGTPACVESFRWRNSVLEFRDSGIHSVVGGRLSAANLSEIIAEDDHVRACLEKIKSGGGAGLCEILEKKLRYYKETLFDDQLQTLRRACLDELAATMDSISALQQWSDVAKQLSEPNLTTLLRLAPKYPGYDRAAVEAWIANLIQKSGADKMIHELQTGCESAAWWRAVPHFQDLPALKKDIDAGWRLCPLMTAASGQSCQNKCNTDVAHNARILEDMQAFYEFRPSSCASAPVRLTW